MLQNCFFLTYKFTKLNMPKLHGSMGFGYFYLNVAQCKYIHIIWLK